MPAASLFSNETTSTNAQCKIVVYNWANNNLNASTTDEELSKSTRLDISSQVTSCTFHKDMGTPSGSFSFQLTNSPGFGSNDWKDIIKQGSWCVIYMSNDGDLSTTDNVGPAKVSKKEAAKIRGVCYIERAGVKITVGDKGEPEMMFEVSGRDFGVIYEETTIWHNFFRYEQIMIDSIKTSQLNVVSNVRIDAAVSLIHDLFFFPANIPGAKVNDDQSLLEIGLQWLLPKEMLSDVGFSLSGLSKGTYWGSLPNIKNFSGTECGIAIENPTDFLSGNAWQNLKQLSIPQLHELFTETTDQGLPQLVFRPIPWAIDKSKYPVAGKFITMYKDLKPVINVPRVDLIDADLAEDDHARYNSFLATVSTGLINVEDNISLLKDSGYPKHNKQSIRRHGFRPMHVTVDSIVKNEELANGAANRRSLVEFNEVLYDYWNQSIFSESGSIQKLGSNDVKIGKALKFNDDVPYMKGKRYYIESYNDSFTIGEKGDASWIQEVSLTRGFEEIDLQNKSGFSQRDISFDNPGEFTPGGNRGSKS